MNIFVPKILKALWIISSVGFPEIEKLNIFETLGIFSFWFGFLKLCFFCCQVPPFIHSTNIYVSPVSGARPGLSVIPRAHSQEKSWLLPWFTGFEAAYP